MKKYTSPLSRLILSVLLIMGFSACETQKLQNAIDDFSVIVGLDPIQTSAVLMLRDASSGELVSAPVKLQFKSSSSGEIIDMFSDPLLKAQTDKGLFTFGIANNLQPSQENAFRFQVYVESDQYLSTTKIFEIQDTGKLNFAVDLIPVNNPPAGINLQQLSLGTTAASGEINDSVNIAFNSGEEAVSFSVAPGNRFLDENAQPLSGALSARASYFDPNEAGAMAAVSDLLKTADGDTAVSLLAAVDLQITDASGKVASQLAEADGKQSNTGNYVLNFILNGTSYAQLQGLLRLAIISPTTAERVFLNMTPEITTLPGGRVELRYLLNSQLFRSLALVYFVEAPCDANLRIDRNGNEGKLTLEISERGFHRNADLQEGRNTLALRNLLRGRKNFKIVLPHTVFTSNFDPCDNPQITLPAPPSTLIDADLRLNLSCKNPEERLRVTSIPATSILFREQASPAGTPWRVASNLAWDYNNLTQVLAGVSCKVRDVTQGGVYDFKAVYDNQTIEYSGEITGTLTIANEVIDHEACQ